MGRWMLHAETGAHIWIQIGMQWVKLAKVELKSGSTWHVVSKAGETGVHISIHMVVNAQIWF